MIKGSILDMSVKFKGEVWANHIHLAHLGRWMVFKALKLVEITKGVGVHRTTNRTLGLSNIKLREMRRNSKGSCTVSREVS